ncbi:hypothetical protein [Rahnella inusitata]|uniref:hypothetical protein n=1 Tax=Rahnella inusitata TaxID=58169 RepID=UPI0039AF97FC
MNWDIMKWLIGIYLGCFLGLLKMAYSDPKFYLEYIDRKFSYVCYTCLIAFSAFWCGLYVARGYVIDNIDLISEQLTLIDKEYNYLTSYLLTIIIGAGISFAASILFIDIARKKIATSASA